MSTSEEAQESENTYFINTESAAEMNRLMIQDKLLTREMGGVLPKDVNPATIHKVLDVACGPGGWVLELASTHRHMEVVGIDLSKKMVDHANSRKWPNTSFRLMNILQPLDFPDNTFDFVNARLLFSFIPKAFWPTLFQECMRILRPGGILRLTECERPLSNSLAFERWGEISMYAMDSIDMSFSADGKQIGITLMLNGFLQEAGCQHMRHASFAIDFSAGGDARGYMYENAQLGFLLVSPFMLKLNPSLSKDELAQLTNQALKDMDASDFRAIWYYLSVWGSKPT